MDRVSAIKIYYYYYYYNKLFHNVHKMHKYDMLNYYKLNIKKILEFINYLFVHIRRRRRSRLWTSRPYRAPPLLPRIGYFFRLGFLQNVLNS